MPEKQYDLTSKRSSSEIRQILNSLNGKNSFLNYFIGKKLFIGTIKENQIAVDSFDSPPIRITGEIKDDISGSVLKLKMNYDSMKNSIKGLMLTIFYCIEFVLVFSYVNRFGFDIWLVPILVIALLFPVVFFKIYWFFNGYDPNPDMIIEKLKRKI